MHLMRRYHNFNFHMIIQRYCNELNCMLGWFLKPCIISSIQCKQLSQNYMDNLKCLWYLHFLSSYQKDRKSSQEIQSERYIIILECLLCAVCQRVWFLTPFEVSAKEENVECSDFAEVLLHKKKLWNSGEYIIYVFHCNC